MARQKPEVVLRTSCQGVEAYRFAMKKENDGLNIRVK